MLTQPLKVFKSGKRISQVHSQSLIGSEECSVIQQHQNMNKKEENKVKTETHKIIQCLQMSMAESTRRIMLKNNVKERREERL